MLVKAVLCMVLFDYQDLCMTHCEVDVHKILWIVAPCSINMLQQYFGEIN